MLKLTTDKHEVSDGLSATAELLALLVVSASDIPLRTIKFFSVLFGVFVHAARRQKQTFASASPIALSTLHGPW